MNSTPEKKKFRHLKGSKLKQVANYNPSVAFSPQLKNEENPFEITE